MDEEGGTVDPEEELRAAVHLAIMYVRWRPSEVARHVPEASRLVEEGRLWEYVSNRLAAAAMARWPDATWDVAPTVEVDATKPAPKKERKRRGVGGI